MEVEKLIPQMQDTLSEISIAVTKLSTKAQDDELAQLEQRRERLLADLQTSFEKERQELDAKRRKRQEEIKQKRKQEDEERTVRRRQEDQELENSNSDEDVQRQKKYDSEVDSIENETGQKLDEVEEVARKIIQDGKQKLQDLDEKRRELNRRIDEQLKQSSPSVPLRNRGRPKKGHGDPQRNGAVVGDSNSHVPRNTDSSSEKSSKLDTPSKPQPPSATDSGVKSLEVKKDGELPFQKRFNGPPQAAMDPTNNLSRSFAEALRNNVSNGSKGKPELEKPSLDGMVQTKDSHSERDTELITSNGCEKSSTEMITTIIPTSMEDVVASGSGAMASGEVKAIMKENKFIEDTESSYEINPQVEVARSRGDNELSHQNISIPQPLQCNHEPVGLNKFAPSRHQQNQSDSRSQVVEGCGPAVPSVDLKRYASNKRPRDQLRISITSEAEIKQLKFNKNTAVSEKPQVLECWQGNTHTLIDQTSNDTVEDSKPTFQPSRLSTTSKKRDPRRQDTKTDDPVGSKQPTTPDILEQNHTGHDKTYPGDLGCLRALGQFSQVSAETVSSSPQTLVEDDPVVSVSRNLSGLSPDRGSSVRFDENQDTTSKRIRTLEKQLHDGLALPLPVENETVHGQDQLFDDNKSAPSPSEPYTSDEHSDLSPCTPIEDQYLPVPLELGKNALDDSGGLTKLLGGSGSCVTLTEWADKDGSRHLPSKVPSIQKVEGFNQLDTKLKAGEDGLKSDESDKLCLKIININHQSTRQDLSPPVTPVSLNHIVLRERPHNLFELNHPSYDINSFNNKELCSHSGPVHMLYSQVLSELAGPSKSRGPSTYATTIDPEKTRDRLRSDNIGRHPKRSKQRGRPRKKSFESLERALNPQELLFQESNDDVNIRAARFKRPKRGTS
ncbi:hypothetical protein F4803DRAFT_570958 [Xylaria telfairii]|nr:hypothetical protein F4803DRAFT_570958 [Xylaria telfairii]